MGEYYSPQTIRCGINQGCSFVMTHNATYSWTPNRIVLTRTGPGPIELDMNPGRVWTVNGKGIFKNERILELGKPFLINDSSHVIVVSFTPRLK